MLSLTPVQRNLIKGSLPTLRTHGETVTRYFYASLLKAHPDLHNIFNSVNQANGRQPRALLSVILAFSEAPGHIFELVPRLERVCQKHVSLGVTPEQYDLIGEYLLKAFAAVLDGAWTPQLAAAWEKAYAMLSRMLISRESQLYREHGAWQGFRFFKIKKKVAEADDIISFHLKPADGKPLPEFYPGQYITLRVDVPSIGYLQSRQYSLSEAPRDDHYRISVKRDRGTMGGKGAESCPFNPGLVSNLLIDKFNVGDLVSVSHPAGSFGFNPRDGGSSPLVFISAGSGATPLMSIFNTVLDSGDVRPMSWIHSSPNKAPFEDHIRAAAQPRSDFAVRFFRTRPGSCPFNPDNEDQTNNMTRRSFGNRMNLENVEPEVLHLSNGATEYFISGPEDFTTTNIAFLMSKGVHRQRIQSETFTTGELEKN